MMMIIIIIIINIIFLILFSFWIATFSLLCQMMANSLMGNGC